MAAADGLAFIAPIYWMNVPAILRGWVERVFTAGFVYTMTADAWRQGDLSGRMLLMRHKTALIMTPTFFRESDYRVRPSLRLITQPAPVPSGWLRAPCE